MKKIVCAGLIILSFMLLLPLAVLKQDNPAAVLPTAAPIEIPKAEKAASDSFRICDTATDTVTEMKAEDYIFGVVAAEMPALYEPEALKAQAVAAYTFACYRRAENADKSYDLTTDHTTDQSFLTEAQARERWNDRADEYCEKLKNAIQAVKGSMVTYGGKPILAVYHAISAGKTEDCADIWGKSLPYLKPVASPGDKLSPDYISTVTVSFADFKAKLADDCTLSGAEKSYFGKFERTASGTVKTVTVCETELNGTRLRSLFNLRSANYTVACTDSGFTFTVYGYGHGVGMSQYGANYMAKQGSDYKEILTCYYSGCKVEKIK